MTSTHIIQLRSLDTEELLNQNDYTFAYDKAWMIISGIYVISIIMAFAFLEMGQVRKKNSSIIFYRHFLHSILTLIAYWIIGYAFAYGDAHSGFIGGKRFYGGQQWDQVQSQINQKTQYSNWIINYGMTNIVISITNRIISERTTLLGTSIHALFTASIIYPLACAWVWGQGWLYDQGFIDYSGSAIIHCTGAFSGLSGLLFIGPRYNRWNIFEDVLKKDKELLDLRQTPISSVNPGSRIFNLENEVPTPQFAKKITQTRINSLRNAVEQEVYETFEASNLTYMLFGGLWVWVCLLFHNSGATFGIIKNTQNLWLQSEHAIVNTFISGACSGLLGLILKTPLMYGLNYPRKLKEQSIAVCNSFLAGIIACGAGMNLYEPWAACVTGVIGTIFYLILCKVFIILRLDDPCEAFPIHGGGGTAGIMVLAFLHPELGILYGNPTNGKIFGTQILGWVSLAGWSFLASSVIWILIANLKILRIDLRTEIIGYDYIEYADNHILPNNELIKRVNGMERINS